VSLLERTFPGWALRREVSRLRLQEAKQLGKRLYDIADPRRGHRFPTLRGRGYSGDDVLQQVGTKHRDWSRYQDENNDFAIAILDALVDQFAPLEPTPQVLNARGEPDERADRQIEELWNEMVEAKALSAAGTPWYEQKRHTGRAWLRDGEVFVRPLRGAVPDVRHPTDVPYTLATYEAEYVPEWLSHAPDLVQGVRVNRWARPIVYLMHRTHPGPSGNPSLRSVAKISQELLEVPAEEVYHLKFSRRVNQVRGITVLHGVQTRLLDLKDYEESERLAAKIASSFSVILTRPFQFGMTPQAGTVPGGSRSIELEAGMVMDFANPGEDVKVVDTNRPSSEVTPFRAAMQRAAAGGTGASYSSVSRDYSGNYSSQRQELVESKLGYQRLREYWTATFLRPVYQDVIAMGILVGRIDARGHTLRSLTRATFDGALMPWIDPVKEATADVLAVQNGFKSRLQVIRERNGNPRDVDAELERDCFVPAPPPAAAAAHPDREESHA
jgi:lambda family phage portal protein